MYLINHSCKLLVKGIGFFYFQFYSDNPAYFRITAKLSSDITFRMQMDSREEKWEIITDRYITRHPDLLSMSDKFNDIIQEQLRNRGLGKEPPILYYE